MRYNQKRASRPSKSAKLWIFTPNFSKFRAFRMLHPPKPHVFLELLAENKTFSCSIRALHTETTQNKWLKKALLLSVFCNQTLLMDVVY